MEQEVEGDDTSALESVLQSDTERSALLAREAELQAAIEKEGGKTNDVLGEELSKHYIFFLQTHKSFSFLFLQYYCVNASVRKSRAKTLD